MKNKYVMSPNYILTLENEELRDRVMELTKQFNELKKNQRDEDCKRCILVGHNAHFDLQFL